MEKNQGGPAMIISIDGNNIGKRVERYILNEELDDLSEFSNSLILYLDTLKKIIETYGGIVYMSGGDNILARVKDSNVKDIISKIVKIKPPNNTTFAIGIGNTAHLAYLALAHRKASQSKRFEVTYCKIEKDNLIFQERFNDQI